MHQSTAHPLFSVANLDTGGLEEIPLSVIPLWTQFIWQDRILEIISNMEKTSYVCKVMSQS